MLYTGNGTGMTGEIRPHFCKVKGCNVSCLHMSHSMCKYKHESLVTKKVKSIFLSHNLEI